MGWLQQQWARLAGGSRPDTATDARPEATDWRALGNAALARGDFEEAARCYACGCDERPQDAALRLNLGFALLELRRFAPAAERLTQALALRRPTDDNAHEIHWLLGRARAGLGETEAALASFAEACRVRPDFVQAMEEALRLLHAGQRHDEAAAWARRMAERQPSGRHWLLLGEQLALAGRAGEAANALARAAAAEPADAGIAAMLAGELVGLRRFDEAVQATDRGLEGGRATAALLVNRASALGRLGRLGEALDAAQAALRLEPGRVDAVANEVMVLTALLRLDEAIDAARAGLRRVPTNVDLHWLLALALLTRGDFAEGWREHEWRLQHPAFAHKVMELEAPRWQGEALAGRTLFLHAEQGFGDNLQFVRFVPRVAAGAGQVLLHVPPGLEPLLAPMLPANCRIVRQGEPIPAMDLQLPLMSLPAVLQAGEADFRMAGPYLRADPAAVDAWRARLPAAGLRVGVAWSGNAGHLNDANRSIPLALVRDIAVDGVHFVTVQPDVRATDQAALDAWTDLRHVGAELRDFGATAALMEALDLVITVDTSVAHLAGALGRPVWILLPHAPDWRWLTRRPDSPWYPSARLFRQPAAGDWASVLARVRGELSGDRGAGPGARGEGPGVRGAGSGHRGEGSGDLDDGHGNLDEPAGNRDDGPGHPQDWKAAGNRALAAGALRAARQCYEQAVHADRADGAAWVNLGYVLLEEGDADAALGALSAALAVLDGQDPLRVDALFLAGQAHARRDDGDAAIASMVAALQARPAFGPALQAVVPLLLARGRAAEAARLAESARAADWSADAAMLEARALHAQAKTGEALATLDGILARDPDHAGALEASGNLLLDVGQADAALARFDALLAARGPAPDPLANRAAALLALDRADEALAAADDALRLAPGHGPAAHNRARALLALGRVSDALAASRAALDRDPGDPDQRWNLAVAHLLLGDLRAGWAAQEARWQAGGFGRPAHPAYLEGPRWTGSEPLEGRTILLFAEQGLGDTLQFVRYVPAVAARAGQVVLAVQPAILPLLHDLPANCRPWRAGDAPPRFDWQCPLLSLPHAFGTEETTIPAPVPYLAADVQRTARWQDELAGRGRRQVGLVWSGNAGHGNDRHRSLPLASLRFALEGADCGFVALQPEVRARDREALAGWPGLLDAGPRLNDFADTAALLQALDLVISVDTSVAHLAGALGRPLWILLPFVPDWRWQLQRPDSPWYPTARLLRQPAEQAWRPVLEALRADLDAWLA